MSMTLELPPHLQTLSGTLSTLPSRERIILAKIREVFSLIDDQSISKSNIAKFIDGIDHSVNLLRTFTENLKTEDLINLFASTGSTFNEATAKARSLIRSLIEKWLSLEEDVDNLKRKLWSLKLEGVGLEDDELPKTPLDATKFRIWFGGEDSVPTGGFNCVNEVYSAWAHYGLMVRTAVEERGKLYETCLPHLQAGRCDAKEQMGKRLTIANKTAADGLKACKVLLGELDEQEFIKLYERKGEAYDLAKGMVRQKMGEMRKELAEWEKALGPRFEEGNQDEPCERG